MTGKQVFLVAAAACAFAVPAIAAPPPPGSFLASLHRDAVLGSSVPASGPALGDENPYSLIVAPVSAGAITKGDVLFDNFNNGKNYQGTGTTIMRYSPQAKAVTVFARIPPDLSSCPGGVGLTTAMTMLKSGWVIVGSMPSKDGTTRTLGQGCLIVLDPEGKVAETIVRPDINGPWGNIATIDRGTSATLFISNIGFGLGAPGQAMLHKATILRLELAIPKGGLPKVEDATVIGSGFGNKASASAFAYGPTGLALGKDGTLYVSDAAANRVVAIPDAETRTTSAGTGTVVTAGRLLKRPLAMIMGPDGHLLVTNALDGKVVEIDPRTHTQIAARWIDKDEAQDPPGSGDLFGIAMNPHGTGFYYVEDDTNLLMEALP